MTPSRAAPCAPDCSSGVSVLSRAKPRRSAGDSCLLRHELAYILGQLGHADSVDDLCAVVRDSSDDAIVRHEAAEALGAIGDERARLTLEAHVGDRAPEVAETCRLALDLLAWRASRSADDNGNAFRSVDPAPPAEDDSLERLRHTLVSEASPLWDRYRAMFRLRDLGGRGAVVALAEAVALPRAHLRSDLLRHELAFVLGQLADEAAAPALKAVLRDSTMHPMVRHEAAEALGAMTPQTATEILAGFASDKCTVVAESCVVALDAMVRRQLPTSPRGSGRAGIL